MNNNILEKISLKNLKIIFTSSIIFSIVYAICFGSIFNIPHLSLFVFASLAIVIIITTINILKIDKNKSAYFWIIPIELIAFSSFIFYSNSSINFMLVITMLVIFTLQLVNSNVNKYLSLNMLLDVFSAIFYRKRGRGAFKALYARKIDTTTQKQKEDNIVKVLIGVLISAPIVAIVFLLLLSADQVFEAFIINIFTIDINLTFVGYLITFVICMPISFYVLINFITSANEKFEGMSKINFDTLIFTVMLIVINSIFVLFCFSQLAYLLFGDGLFTLPSGFTHADYARSGFFQLLFVAVINYAVILTFLNFMSNLTSSKVINILLSSLVIFTIILVISSFYRIILYTDYYGFTQLRLQVILFLVFTFILLLLTFTKIVKANVNIGRSVTVVILLAFISNAYFGNGYIAAMLNYDLYQEGKLENIEVDYYIANYDYIAYIDKVSDDINTKNWGYYCDDIETNWRSYTFVSKYIKECE